MPTVTILSQPPSGTFLQIDKGTTVSVIGGTNLGSGTGIFSGVSGANFQFKSLVAGAGISLSNSSTTVTITGSGILALANGRGTTANGSAIDLGGNIATSAVLILTAASQAIQLTANTSNPSSFSVNRGTGVLTAISSMSIDSTDGSKTAGIKFDIDNVYGGGAGVYFKDTRTTTKGLEYLADYSAGYTTRSLVDKGYITTTLGSYVTSASLTSTLSTYLLTSAFSGLFTSTLAASNVVDTNVAWITSGLSYGGGYTTGTPAFAYKKTGRGTIKLQGVIHNAGANSGDTFVTLPAGFRPTQAQTFIVASPLYANRYFFWCTISTAGVIAVSTYLDVFGAPLGTTDISFDGIEYE